jgi:hypothetical protein
MYDYQDLRGQNAFRIFHLLPGQADEEIQGQLVHDTLTSAHEYFAVSYLWGDAQSSRNIVIDKTAVSVRESLYQLFLHLRESQASLALWIDAICINQDNYQEKSTQIPLMGRIYSSAKSVLVWLGLSSDDSDTFFKSQYANGGIRITHSDAAVGHDKMPLVVTNSHAINALYSREYWTRTWIVQEIVLASKIDIYCGDYSCSWESFTAHVSQGGNEYDRAAPDHLLRNIMSLRIIGTNLSLRRLLFRFHQSRCSNPRDLVFSLLNIASDTRNQDHGIIVNYAHSVEAVFVHTLAFCSGLTSVTVQGGASGRAIGCLRFCDTLATRMGACLSKSYYYAQYAPMVQSDHVLLARLSLCCTWCA